MQTLSKPDTLADLGYARISKTLADLGVSCYVGHSAPTAVEGTGEVWVALLNGPDDLTRSIYSTSNNRTLVVNIYADVTRQPALLEDAESRAWGVFEIVDPLLDWTNTETWPEVILSMRSGTSMIPVPDGDGAVLLSVRYAIRTW